MVASSPGSLLTLLPPFLRREPGDEANAEAGKIIRFICGKSIVVFNCSLACFKTLLYNGKNTGRQAQWLHLALYNAHSRDCSLHVKYDITLDRVSS